MGKGLGFCEEFRRRVLAAGWSRSRCAEPEREALCTDVEFFFFFCGRVTGEEGVPSLCFSSSLKLFNLSERRHDISKLHPKVGRARGERGAMGAGEICGTSSCCKLLGAWM